MASAYPEFIGFGYASCLTCHYNGQGSGPLNDYGRALWSAEIASRAIYPRSMTDEDIAAQSGFLGTIQMPAWLRPHVKYRDVNLIRNYQSSSQTQRFYRMQVDAGVTVSDPDSNYVGVLTFGDVVQAGENKMRFLAREYFFRTEVVKSYWLYVGLLEKVFGLRNIDHESFQRKPQGFRYTLNEPSGMAQSHGVVLQKIEDTWDFAINGFVGNPYDDPQYRQKGFSTQSELEVGEKKRLGFSLYSGKSDTLEKNMAAVHYRQAVAQGSAVMAEYGLIQDDLQGVAKTRGSYNLLQSLISLTRGYNLKTTIERYNKDFKPSEPDIWRWSVGVLAFPLPRLELRGEIVNGRAFSDQAVSDDVWYLQGQIHVSL